MSIIIQKSFDSPFLTRMTFLGCKSHVRSGDDFWDFGLACWLILNLAALLTKYKGPDMEKPAIRPYTPTSDEGWSR